MTADRLTPEERAVIEAADAMQYDYDNLQEHKYPLPHETLALAVRALRESREKWREHRLVADALIGPHGRVVFVHEDAYRHIILALLNAGERALADK